MADHISAMKVELHLHTSRYSPCARRTPGEMMARLIETGYQAVYLTEHDAVWRADELAALRAAFPEIRIFPGVELTLAAEDMHHLLVLGTNDPAYLALKQDTEILAAARARGHLTVLAHPIRMLRGAAMLEAGHLPDALEQRTGNHGPYRAAVTRRMAEPLGLPLVNAGDAHDLDDVDRYWIETHRPIEQARDIRDIVLAGAYEQHVREPRPARAAWSFLRPG